MNDGISQKLQLVIIESPYDSWDHPLVPTLFAGMIGLKRSGYGGHYHAPVLPVDTTDFIATHVLLCAKEGPGLRPVMGYKTTALADCQRNNLVFPGLTLVRNSRAEPHTRAVETIVDRCAKSGTGLAYLGSWTVDPDYKKRSGLRNELREIFLAAYNWVYRQQGIEEVVIGGTLRFGTEKLFGALGHRPLSLEGQELPPIRVAHLAGEPVQVMHSRGMTDAAAEAERKWRSIWTSRLHIAATDERRAKLRSAA